MVDQCAKRACMSVAEVLDGLDETERSLRRPFTVTVEDVVEERTLRLRRARLRGPGPPVPPWARRR